MNVPGDIRARVFSLLAAAAPAAAGQTAQISMAEPPTEDGVGGSLPAIYVGGAGETNPAWASADARQATLTIPVVLEIAGRGDSAADREAMDAFADAVVKALANQTDLACGMGDLGVTAFGFTASDVALGYRATVARAIALTLHCHILNDART